MSISHLIGDVDEVSIVEITLLLDHLEMFVGKLIANKNIEVILGENALICKNNSTNCY